MYLHRWDLYIITSNMFLSCVGCVKLWKCCFVSVLLVLCQNMPILFNKSWRGDHSSSEVMTLFCCFPAVKWRCGSCLPLISDSGRFLNGPVKYVTAQPTAVAEQNGPRFTDIIWLMFHSLQQSLILCITYFTTV